jgi:hypothetical protein
MRPVTEFVSLTQEAREETKSKIDQIQIKIHKLIQTTKKLYQIEKLQRISKNKPLLVSIVH